MKKILFIILVTCSMFASAQDTTIATLSIKARLVQTLAPFVKFNNDTAYVNLLNRWIEKFHVANPPSGVTLVVTDSIAVTVIADCYRKCYSFPQGALAVGSDFAADVAAIRAGNNYLDRLLDAIDTEFAEKIANARTFGRTILTGKLN